MNTKLITTGLIAGALLAPFAVYAADSDSSTTATAKTKDFVKDSVITTKIKGLYVKDKQVSALHVKVDTDEKGVVTLSGKAKTQAEADRAVTIARGVKGVTDVNNNIEISAN